MQKRKQMAMKKKGSGGGFEIEIAGADEVEDLLQESNLDLLMIDHMR